MSKNIFVPFKTTDSAESLASAILADVPRISLVEDSVTAVYGMNSGETSISFYNDPERKLSIGPGVLLTSGDSTPPESNSATGFGATLNPSNTDADLAAEANKAFEGAGEVKDVSSVEFQFNVDKDSGIKSIRFDLVFGSDEFPEFSDSSFVDIGAVFINGKNEAFFSNGWPLSVVSQNVDPNGDGSYADGSFYDNSEKTYPIEYDGISKKLAIILPVEEGVNTIKVAVGDTGDQILDTGLIISNLRGVEYTTSNSLQAIQLGTTDNDSIDGTAAADIIDAGSGDDIIRGGNGNDVMDGENGIDTAVFLKKYSESKLQRIEDGWKVGVEGNDVILNVEFAQFAGDIYIMETGRGSQFYELNALCEIYGYQPSVDFLSFWSKKFGQYTDMTDMAQTLIDTYVLGLSNSDLVQTLFQTIFSRPALEDELLFLIGEIGSGKSFETQGDLFLYAALYYANGQTDAETVGQPYKLNSDFFDL